MLRAAQSIRISLVAFSVLAMAPSCGGLGDRHGDASRPDSKITDLAPLGQDGLATFPDAGIDTKIGQLDADGTEASAGIDAEVVPPTTDAGLAPEAPAPLPATIVVLPDTQYYASSYHDVFTSQANWILEQKPILNIAAVLHVGDIVDGDTAAQWAVANSAMRVLDNHVPYFLVPGNHDVDGNRKTMIDSYFSPATMPWVTSTMTVGQIENNYALVDIGPQKWLVLGLEFGPRDSVITWADAVLKAYPNNPAIIVTHAYLYNDGNRYDIAVSGFDSGKPNYQWYIPQTYGYTSSQGTNDGEMIWQKLILPNANVRLVFSGHVTGAARLTSTRPDGSRVHQMVSDYQWYRIDQPDYYGGGGYLRLVQFDFGKQQIHVQTYSPYLKQYITDDANQFSLEMQP
jgi:Calcineurin-like phosphoesterase